MSSGWADTPDRPGEERGEDTEYISLFRAVGQGELIDILEVGGFRPGGGHMEAKLFATSAADAANFGRGLYRYDRVPFTIVEAQIPRSLADHLYHTLMDRMPSVAVDREELAEFNLAVRIIVHDTIALKDVS